MTDDVTQVRPATAAGSPEWQPDAVAANRADLSSYLERVFDTPAIRELLARTTELLQLRAGQSILEVGCGVGVILPYWAERVGPAGRVVAIDHAESFVTEARDRVARLGLTDVITVELADAYALPYRDDSFDAAHCERVLMHLADPTAALREMHRVVRPGGRVVVAEPDWRMIPFDHPDPDAMAALYAQKLKQFRQPEVGRTLYRRFGECGLIDRQIVPMVSPITDVSLLRTYGLELEKYIDDVVAGGVISRERAENAIAYLERSSNDGQFFSAAVGFVVAGIVPET